jgi:hypothetical protein
VSGGIRENTFIEIWIVPVNAQPPETLQKKPDEIKVTNSLLFGMHGSYLDVDNCGYDIDCPSGKYHFARLDYFARQLKLNPNLKGYLIAYARYCPNCGSYGKYSPSGKFIREEKISYRDKSGTATMILKSEKDYLVKSHNIELSRIITVNGGHREYRNIELWLVPENGEKPKPKPTTFPPKHSKTAKKKARSK